MIELSIDVEGWPDGTDWEALARRCVKAALCVTPYAGLADSAVPAELSISFADNDAVHALNAQWRDKDKPTNVLSFPMIEPESLPDLIAGKTIDAMLGDIILAAQICAVEADEREIPVENHAAHLLVHGTLHILGYDHIDDAEGDHMESLERAALAQMGIDDPYAR